MSFNIEEFAKKFVEIIIALLINFFLEYNQINLALKSCNLIAFMISLKLRKITRLSQNATNLIAQFVKIVIRILKNLFNKYYLFVSDINIKKFRSNYNNKKTILKIKLFVLKYI